MGAMALVAMVVFSGLWRNQTSAPQPDAPTWVAILVTTWPLLIGVAVALVAAIWPRPLTAGLSAAAVALITFITLAAAGPRLAWIPALVLLVALAGVFLTVIEARASLR